MRRGAISDSAEVSGDRHKGLDCEGGAEAAEGEIIERQVHREEAEAEAPARRIVQQECHARRAACQKAGAGEKRDAEHSEHAARHKSLRVIEKRVSVRRRVHKSGESGFCLPLFCPWYVRLFYPAASAWQAGFRSAD